MKVLVIIIIILALILLLRVGVIAEYSEEGFTVMLKAGPLSFLIFPGKEKEKKKKDKKEKKKKDKKEKEKPEKKGGSFRLIMEILPQVFDMLSAFRQKLQIDDLRIHFVSASDSPYTAALNYGYASAALGTLLALIENFFKLKKRDITTDVSFTDKSPTVFLKAQLTIRIGQILGIAIVYGLKILKTFLKFKRENSQRKAEH